MAGSHARGMPSGTCLQTVSGPAGALGPDAGQLVEAPHMNCPCCGATSKPGDQLCLQGHAISRGPYLAIWREIRRGHSRGQPDGEAGSYPRQVQAHACPHNRLAPAAILGDAELAATDITILLPPPRGRAGLLALTTHTHTFTTLGSHRLEGQVLFLSKGADLQKG